MKGLTELGLRKVFSLLKKAPLENQYKVKLQENTQYTFTVPNYAKGKSIVEVYMNGLRLAENEEYTLSTTGQVKLINTVKNSNNYLHVIHRKYG